MERSVRWLDRCIAYHESSGKKDTQNLFAIVQGGLDLELRDQSLDEMIKRKEGVAGFAIGGLSGGEEKGMQRQAPNTYKISQEGSCCRCVLANVLILLMVSRVTLTADQYQTLHRQASGRSYVLLIAGRQPLNRVQGLDILWELALPKVSVRSTTCNVAKC